MSATELVHGALTHPGVFNVEHPSAGSWAFLIQFAARTGHFDLPDDERGSADDGEKGAVLN